MLRAAEVYREPALVNLSSSTETSIRDLVAVIAEATGFTGEIAWDPGRPDGQERRAFDVTKARTDLGWAAKTPLREGIAKTVAWYRANRDRARNVA
jgi:GDP-L-fucose synthase